MKRAVIAFPTLKVGSFVQQDIETLSARYDVRVCPARSAGQLLRAGLEVWRSDLLFCWFGSLRYLPLLMLARLRGIPVLVVAGGYDVAREPEIEYGNMRGGLTRLLGRLLFRLAHRCLSYSEAGREEAIRNAGVPAGKIDLIPLGFDGDRFRPGPQLETRPDRVLTVGGIDESTIFRKGLLTVARMTRLLPDVATVFAGRAKPAALATLAAAAGTNAAFAGFVTDDELDRLYLESKVYVQPSIHEAFGCSVAEAMLCGCIPVVSDRGSLPEVVGTAGYIVPADDPEALARAVQLGLRGPPPGGESPRDRILKRYSLEQRRQALYRVVDFHLAT